MIALVNPSTVDALFATDAIRERCLSIYQLAQSGGTSFVVDETKLNVTALHVVDVIKQSYPDLDVPYHSRWRHFHVPGYDFDQQFLTRINKLKSKERAKIGLDLILPSVLLDAGAGADWAYTPPGAESAVPRSEGLALASIVSFMDGKLSNDQSSMRTDAEELQRYQAADLEEQFQVSSQNPLLGIKGRVGLINALGRALANKPDIFPNQRPGDLVTYLEESFGTALTAHDILNSVFHCFGEIWPGREEIDGRNMGDCWKYTPLGEGTEGLVPIHKLSQWLTYSIIETLEMGGFTITGLERLTGLAEYRNGGLFLDERVLQLRDPALAAIAHTPDSKVIVEWRALTIILLDRLAPKIRDLLGVTEQQFPLAKILEGGTWAAGRAIANRLRPGGNPPLNISSDGTVF